MNYTFTLTPVPKPRMTRADAWKKRPAVVKYYEYKDELRRQAKEKGYTIGNTLDIIFHVPMPDSWSNKKKSAYMGTPHMQKPDIDNLLKGFMDALLEEDSHVHTVVAQKVWGETGKIILQSAE